MSTTKTILPNATAQAMMEAEFYTLGIIHTDIRQKAREWERLNDVVVIMYSNRDAVKGTRNNNKATVR